MVGLRPERRRHRLLLRVGVGAVILCAVAVGIVILRPSAQQYVPGSPVEGLTTDLLRTLPSGAPAVQYTEASSSSGIVFQHFHGTRSHQLPEDMGSGAAWADVDGDGDLDLFAVNEAGSLSARGEWADSPAHNSLFVNGGQGSFREAAADAGLDRRGLGQGAAFADADGDGDADLAVSEYGPLWLYANQGDGRFIDAHAYAGIDQDRFWTGLNWADVDGDGDLDLYACAYVDYRDDPSLRTSTTHQYDIAIPASLNPSTFQPQTNALWRNDGDLQFTEVAVAAGVDNAAGRSLSATFADFDEDGHVDLYVANDLSDNVLFQNRGDGVFTDVSHAAWVADYRGAMGLAAGDWDNDGDEDLFITHWIAQENALFSNMTSDYRQAGVAASLRFMDTADQFGLGQIALDYIGWGTSFVDYDADGRLDLLVANGSTFETEEDADRLVPMRMLLFWNSGPSDGFFEVGGVSGEVLERPVVGRGLALADYDADGDVDAFVNVNGGRGLLLRNEGHQQHWLTLAAVEWDRWPAARLRVVTDTGQWIRQAGTGSSYLSQNALGEEYFGLGGASRVNTVEIFWADGVIQRWHDLGIDRHLSLSRTGESTERTP